MSLADDLQILDEWFDDAPEEAGRFAVALNTRYPKKNTEDALIQFAIDAPNVYQNMITRLKARYTKTREDLAKEIGRRVAAAQGIDLG